MSRWGGLLLIQFLWPALLLPIPKPQHLRLSRDPFRPLVSHPHAGPGAAPVVRRPPGKAGLRWQSLQIQGIALGGRNAAVALAATGQGMSYLLRPGDRLFNALIVRISLRGIWLEELAPAGPRGRPHGKLRLLPMRP